MSSRFNNPGLEGNPHFIDVTAIDEPVEQQISATLALAYEQRTANLIALYATQPQTFPAGHPILTMLTKRMGL